MKVFVVLVPLFPLVPDRSSFKDILNPDPIVYKVDRIYLTQQAAENRVNKISGSYFISRSLQGNVTKLHNVDKKVSKKQRKRLKTHAALKTQYHGCL